MADDWLRANWPAPPGVHCLSTTRGAGAETDAPFGGFNLSGQVGDDAARVARHRKVLREELAGSPRLHWLKQVHGTRVVDAGTSAADDLPTGDAWYCRDTGLACGILTADCLALCLCSRDGREMGVAHAGWRGLAQGVLEELLARFSAPSQQILAWLGPAIGPCHFEVGDEVRRAFLSAGRGDPDALQAAFQPGRPGKWQADLYALARARLHAAGVEAVFGGGQCTYCDPAQRFYSYRRQARTGRFATLIWRT